MPKQPARRRDAIREFEHRDAIGRLVGYVKAQIPADVVAKYGMPPSAGDLRQAWVVGYRTTYEPRRID